jgi:hypothetical protein
VSIYQRKYLQPRREMLKGLLERARVQSLLTQNADVEILCDMLSGAMLYRLLFQPEGHSDKKARAYLLKLFQQAEFGIPHSGMEQE